MNNTIRITSLDKVRHAAAVLLALSMVALAADVYSQPGARQSPINIDKSAVVDEHRPSITAFYQSNVTLSDVNTFNPNRVPFVEKEWATLRASYSGAPASFVMGRAGVRAEFQPQPGTASLTAPSTFSNCMAQGGSIEDQLSADIFPENVQWVVSRKKIEMSKRQIRAFTRLFEEGNSRSAQPLNSRVVTRVRD